MPKGGGQELGYRRQEEETKEEVMAKEGLRKWFSRNDGKGWIDCKTGGPCGRKSAKGGSKRPYPACRPTKAQCTSAKNKKKGPERISWKSKKKKGR
tara:strand:+ start:868 stop:1155 length:288 start_codon:yes stop_codon:yes gene_type:complete